MVQTRFLEAWGRSASRTHPEWTPEDALKHFWEKTVPDFIELREYMNRDTLSQQEIAAVEDSIKRGFAAARP